MPRGDRTGPAGMGPMTGRAAGYCAGYGVPGFANPIAGGMGFGRGMGYGRGMGFGFRGGRGGRWGAGYGYGVPYAMPYAAPPSGAVPYIAEPTRQQQAEALQDQADYLEKSLAEIRKRLAELETEAEKK